MYELASQAQPTGLSFGRLAQIGKRQWWVVVLCIVLAALGSLVYVKTRPITYSVAADVIVGNASVNSSSNPTTQAQNAALLVGGLAPAAEIKAPAVVRAAASAGHVAKSDVKLTATSSGTTNVLITATAPSARQATDMANVAASAFVSQRISDLKAYSKKFDGQLGRLNNEITTVKGQIAAKGPKGNTGADLQELGVLNTEYSTLYQTQVTVAGSASAVSTGTKAKVSSATVIGRSKKTIEVALAAGLLAGLGIALAREQLDDKIRSSSEVAEFGKSELLAELPTSDIGPRSATIADKPFGEMAEAVRELRTALRFLSVKHPIRTVLVTSAGAGEGKSFVAANLAAAWAMSGVRTILVSSDLRKPSLERLLRAGEERKGLSEAIVDAALLGHGRSMSGFSYLDHETASDALPSPSGERAERVEPTPLDVDDLELDGLEVDDLLVPTAVDGLMLLPSGPSPPNPAELLGSPELGKLLVALRERAEVVVLDSPPVLAVTDALVLTAQADGVLFVVSENRTSRGAAQRALRQLESGLAPVLGVVVNRSSRQVVRY